MKFVTKPEQFASWSMDASLDFETELTISGVEFATRIELDRRLFYVDRFEIYSVKVTLSGVEMPWTELTSDLQNQVEKAIEDQDDMDAEDAYMREQENLRS